MAIRKNTGKRHTLASFYTNLREAIKNASGEKLEMKEYKADMRHLVDSYLQADEPREISEFESLSILEIIVRRRSVSRLGDAAICTQDH